MRRYRNVRHDLQKKYGISREQYEQMIESQGGKCAICQDAFERTPHVDHCHVTGINRSLLCLLCNQMLGQGKDDPVRLERGAAYLRSHGK